MNRLLRRLTACVLVGVLVLSVAPLEALANLQGPVEGLVITNLTPASARNYTIDLKWDLPGLTGADPTPGIIDPGVQHQPAGYEVSYRNASSNSGYILLTTLGAAARSYRTTLPLEEASIFEFQVVPFHKHTIPAVLDQDGSIITPAKEVAALDTGRAVNALFFTDIIVEKPEASGQQIEITWTAPTYGGVEVFSGYRFFWRVDDKSGYIDTSALDTYSASVSAAQLSGLGKTVAGGKRQYTYTFTASPSLAVGVDYAFKIEPLVLSRTGRDVVWRLSAEAHANPPSATPTMPVSAVDYIYAHTDAIATGADSSLVREYRAPETFRLKIPVYVLEENNDQLRIYWDSSYVVSDPLNPPNIRIYKSSVLGVQGTQIGTLGKASIPDINFWITEKPDEPMYYYIYIERDGDAGTSYNPDMESYWAYYDPNAIDFMPYSPGIIDISPDGLNWRITWEAFLRDVYNSGDTPVVNDKYGLPKYIDRSVSYEIWVTDDVTNFNDGVYLSSVVRYTPGTAVEYGTVGNGNWSYSAIVNSYYAMSSTGAQIIEPNNIYYVRIVAIRGDSVSAASYGSFYVPAGSLQTAPLMMAKPPLKVDSTELDAINISWATKWYEVYNSHSNPKYGNTAQPEGWYASVEIEGDGTYNYGSDSADALNFTIDRYTGIPQEDAEAIINTETANDGTLPVRFVDLTGASYQLHVAKFDDVTATAGGAAAYLTKLLEPGNTLWQTITPDTSVPVYPTYRITKQIPTGAAIASNTAYVVFFRPVVQSQTVAECYPTYLACTTPAVQSPLEIIPTVPILKAVTSRTTDRSVTVYWEASNTLEYELAYSDVSTQYPNGGKLINYQEILTNGKPVTIDGKNCYEYTISGLFAGTEYYVWIRSAVGSPKKISAWSNPVTEYTKDLETPMPPRGLGLASRDIVDSHNIETGVQLVPLDENYMIIEWMRDQKDTGTETSSTTVGDVTSLSSSMLTNSFMAKFGSLVANRLYYIRAKTILTMVRSGSTIKVQYSYRVQLSTTDEFVDVLEIYIPALDPTPSNPRDMIRNESDWTSTIHIKTRPSTGEYDGAADEKLYPLPTSDFEVTYDSNTGELKYRFRSTGVAADGTHDNSVDQRFISKMIQDRVYTYTLDLTRYSSQTVKRRTLEIPYSIVSAMDERKVSLRFIADNLTLTFAPESLRTAQVNAVKDFSAAATAISFSVEQEPSGLPALNSGEEFASKPHSLSIRVTTPSQNLSLTTLDKELAVALRLANRYMVYDTNVNTYVNEQGAWAAVKSSYDNTSGTMSFGTKRVGTYSAIAKPLPTTTDGSQPTDAAYTLMNRLNITDLKSYNPNQAINASQFNNIVAAIARGNTSVAIYANMSDADYQALGKTRILVTGTEVSREAGINALIRLYELKTNAAVKNYGTLSTTAYKDIASASAEYQTALLKAAKLGFFKSPTASSPKANLTMNDAFEMFEIIIDDAGL